MRSLVSSMLTVLVLMLPLAGCEKAAEEPAAPEDATTGTALPATLFAATAPSDAIPLIEAKTSASPGDRVVFSARVGGRAEAFVENRAIFFVADPSLKHCDDLHPGQCKKPWDYCCESPDNLLKHMATVQVVDAGGQPLKVSLHETNGLEGLKIVYVTGTVAQKDVGTFVVNAESIHVEEG